MEQPAGRPALCIMAKAPGEPSSRLSAS